MKGNCMMGCAHCAFEEIYKKVEFKDDNGEVWGKMNEFNGYRHFCNGGHQDEYDAWHERNKDNTYAVYSKDNLPCFEPDTITRILNDANELARKILDDMDSKKSLKKINE